MSRIGKHFAHKYRRRGPLGVYASESAIGNKNVSISASFLPGSDIVNVGVTVKPSILPFSFKYVIEFVSAVDSPLNFARHYIFFSHSLIPVQLFFFLYARIPSCTLSRCSQPWSFDGFEVALGNGKQMYLLDLIFPIECNTTPVATRNQPEFKF